MPANKVKFNLKNVYASIVTETVDNGVVSYSYATPQWIPGAVSLSLDPEGESSPFYADGIVYFRTVVNNGYTGDLEIALIPEWFREQILQETKDENGVFIETANVTDPVKFALLFEFIVKTWEMFPEVIDTSFEKVLWNKEFLFNIFL